ncbi:MAG: hypothetical protein EOP42_04240 [Sphingobacteriaceae bacterium]|nr:MAG: hypothetical protein EOP42_04240 [Sphingobacteriaceae bacterium]
MKKTIVKLCYRKIINAQATKPWDKLVFEDSYAEFRIQMQNYEQFRQYPAYGDLVHHAPKARQLSQQVTPAITGYMQQLNSIVPDIFNNLGRRFLHFERFHFEIINSHFEQKDRHQVAINFFSEPMIWHATIDSYLLLSPEAQTEEGEIHTHLMQLQPFLSIHSLKEETE